MIKAQGLIKKFPPNDFVVIKGIDMTIKDGDFISLMGRSGSGKSTLLYLLSTLDRSFEGKVHIDNRDVHQMDVKEVHALRNQQIGFVFQFHYLINELTVLENVLLPARKAGRMEEALPFARELLSIVGLDSIAHKPSSSLSGGENQRVAIARALIMKPKYIFADEPTGNLDSINGNVIFNLFKKFNKDFGTTIVYVTHDQEFGKLAHTQIKLADGLITTN
ncbi:MAG: ABC transporter ATP-binding protein [Bacteriovoracaceae bacterium]|nr:ABC transporter ATP-binding protein [Bacteriovoracaceae bacterium]